MRTQHWWILLAAIVVLLATWWLRYELVPTDDGNAYRLDRWTGHVAHCSIIGCS